MIRVDQSSEREVAREAASPDDYRAVSITLDGQTFCSVAQALEGCMFLVREAPELPLNGCTRSATCGCHYEHFRDRRGEPRRDADDGVYQFWDFDERRASAGRRAGDRTRPLPWEEWRPVSDE